MKKLFFLLLLFSSSFSYSNYTWKNIIQTGDDCKYNIPHENLGFSWITFGYNDQSWIAAKSGIGFGDNDDNTIIDSSVIRKGIYSIYIRFHFTIKNIKEIKALMLDVDYDDGFVAYLNEQEVERGNVNASVTWNMELGKEHKTLLSFGKKPESFVIETDLKNSLLKNGDNILAIEIHNATPFSEGLSSNIFLQALVPVDNTDFRDVPGWFEPPVIFSKFNLPLLVIDSKNQLIDEKTKRIVQMKFSNFSYGNYEFEKPNEYSGRIEIKQRGNSSLAFEKKSYSIELQKEDGSNNNVSILNLPSEHDFVLYAPFSDKTMIRNVMSYELYNKMGYWAPRTKFIELIINNKYEGIYVLTEKVKQDKNRVNIKKLTPEDSSGLKLTGGYILRNDKVSSNDSDFWVSQAQQIYNDQLIYQYYYPSYDNIISSQCNYIKNYMENFDNMMSSSAFTDPLTGYHSFIDEKSFINMMIINELSKNVDAYKYSSYMYKMNQKSGGKLFAGPPWDYDLTYGNLNYYYEENIPYTYDFVYHHHDRNYWWQRLMEDTTFENKVHCAWENYRKTMLADKQIDMLIDSCVNYLGPAIDRNFKRYPILGLYVWPNAKYPKTYEEEIVNLKKWVHERTEWLDAQWKDQCNNEQHTEVLAFKNNVPAYIFPNPSDFKNISIHIADSENRPLIIQLMEINGRIIEKLIATTDSNSIIILRDHSDLPSGIYLYKIVNRNGTITGKLVKK